MRFLAIVLACSLRSFKGRRVKNVPEEETDVHKASRHALHSRLLDREHTSHAADGGSKTKSLATFLLASTMAGQKSWRVHRPNRLSGVISRAQPTQVRGLRPMMNRDLMGGDMIGGDDPLSDNVVFSAAPPSVAEPPTQEPAFGFIESIPPEIADWQQFPVTGAPFGFTSGQLAARDAVTTKEERDTRIPTDARMMSQNASQAETPRREAPKDLLDTAEELFESSQSAPVVWNLTAATDLEKKPATFSENVERLLESERLPKVASDEKQEPIDLLEGAAKLLDEPALVDDRLVSDASNFNVQEVEVQKPNFNVEGLAEVMKELLGEPAPFIASFTPVLVDPKKVEDDFDLENDNLDFFEDSESSEEEQERRKEEREAKIRAREQRREEARIRAQELGKVSHTLHEELPQALRKELNWNIFSKNVKVVDSTDNKLEGLTRLQLFFGMIRDMSKKLKVSEDVQVHFIDGEGFQRLGLGQPFEPFLVARFQLKFAGRRSPLRFWRKTNPVEIEVQTVFTFDENHKVDTIGIDKCYVNGKDFFTINSWPNVNIYGSSGTNLKRLEEWLEDVSTSDVDTMDAIGKETIVPSEESIDEVAVVKQVPTTDRVLTIATPKKGPLVKEKMVNVCKKVGGITENCYKSCVTKDALTFCALGGAADAFVQLSSGARMAYNLKRTLGFMVFGSCYCGGFQPNMYKLFDRFLGNGTTMKEVLPKLFVDVFVYEPVMYVPAFYMITGLVQGLGWAGSWQRLLAKYASTVLSTIGIWLGPLFIYFRWVPQKRRPMYLAVCGFVERCVFSMLSGAAH